MRMCLRTLVLLLLRGRVPNKEDTLLASSQDGDGDRVRDRDPLLSAKLEPPLLRPRERRCRPELAEKLREFWRDGKSLEEKKQPSSSSPSVVLAALRGLGEHMSPNTLSSVAVLLELPSLEKRRPRRAVGWLRAAEGTPAMSFKLPESVIVTLSAALTRLRFAP